MIRRPLPLLLALSLSAALLACGDGSSDLTGRSLQVVSFRASPDPLATPGTTTLSWTTSGATSISLLRGEEPVELDGAAPTSGSVDVEVLETTTFELIALHGEKSAAASLTVRVIDAPAIGSLSAPEVVGADELGVARAAIAWTGAEGEALVLESDHGDPITLPAASMPDGDVEVELTQSTTFTLVARLGIAEARESAQVRVVPLPAIDTLVTDRPWVGPSEEVQVAWTTTGAASVELWLNGERVGTPAPLPPTGSYPVTIAFDSTIELRAVNELGDEVSDQVEVRVSAPLILDFALSTGSLWLGQSVSFSWQTRAGSELRVIAYGIEEPLCAPAPFAEIASSSCQWKPEAPGLYQGTLTLSNGSGYVEEEWQLRVGTGPTIEYFTVLPATVSQGEAVTASWKVLPDPAGEVPTLELRDAHGSPQPLSPAEGTLALTMDAVGTHTFTFRAETGNELSSPAEEVAAVEVVPAPGATLALTPDLFDDSLTEDLELAWTSQNAVSLALYVIVDGEQAELHTIPPAEYAAGSIRVAPRVNSTYRLVATNTIGSRAEATAEVQVAPTEVLTFTATPLSLSVGQPVTLSWTSRMADELRLSFAGETYFPNETAGRYLDAQALGGARVELTDECTQAANIYRWGCAFLDLPQGFTFPFGGEDRRSARIYGNGVLSFDTTHLEGGSDMNYGFPSTSTAGAWAHLAPFWDKLSWDNVRYPTGNIYMLHRPDPTGDSVVIQWKDVGFPKIASSATTGSLHFEIILWANGDFEYRYGEMDSGESISDFADGQSATIGFQLPDHSESHLRGFEGNPSLRGPLSGRSFTYERTPVLEKRGSFVWYPATTSETTTVTLTAQRGETTHSRTLDLDVSLRPYIQAEAPPSLVGEPFRLTWTTRHGTALEVVDPEGVVRCAAESQGQVDEGFCPLSEDTEGFYEYLVRVTGAHGYVEELPVTVPVYAPFGIDTFVSDQGAVGRGDSVTLSWTTRNATRLDILADGVEIGSPDVGTGAGSFVATNVTQKTDFTLRLTNFIGLVEERTLTVELWTVAIDLSPSTTSVRPGEPVTVTIDAADLEGGPVPTIFGTLPLEDVSATSPFVSIAGQEGAQLLVVSASSSSSVNNVGLPFLFPYFGYVYSEVRTFLDGYVSFTNNAAVSATNAKLPAANSANNRNVHIAPFWDDLHPRAVAEMWVKTMDADTFIIEWKNVDLAAPTSADRADLNFQLVLFSSGAFEYRYGAMNPIPQGGKTTINCRPNIYCENEVKGSSATIGYQNPGGTLGFTEHFGGASSVATNPTYPGGLANRSLRYTPVVGRTTVTFKPVETITYSICALAQGVPVCKKLPIEADFGLDSYDVSASRIDLGASTTISWTSTGGKKLTIRDGETVAYTTDDLALIDAGSVRLSPRKNTVYELEVTAGTRRAAQAIPVEVERIKLSVTAPPTAVPGQPFTLSWTLTNSDAGMTPVVLAPFSEVSDTHPFSALDLRFQEGVTEQAFTVQADNTRVNIPLPAGFTFDYFGQVYSEVQIAADGYIGFDLTATTSSPSNQKWPYVSESFGRYHIAPFWDDLHFRGQGRVLTKLIGDGFVIQWSGVSLKLGTSDGNRADLNFMVVLYRSGDIEFRYGAMDPPPQPVTGTSNCAFLDCVNEVNGSAATLGFQFPGGAFAQVLHYGGASPLASNPSFPGGTANRSFRFHRLSGDGSVRIRPPETGLYKVCAFDPVTTDSFCSQPLEVEARWGIGSFQVTPEAPLAGDQLSLSWNVTNLDSLRITANGDELVSHVGAAIPAVGSIHHSPTVATTYILEGVSFGRTVREERRIEFRAFDLSVQGPVGRLFPGDKVNLSWTLHQLDGGATALTTPMVEIDAGAGKPGAFVDISGLEGATKDTIPVSFPADTGSVQVELPFTFPYFGGSYWEIRAYVDGYVSFKPTANSSGNGLGSPLPAPLSNGADVNLAPFWDNLQLAGNGDGIWTYSPDPTTFIIQWKRMGRYTDFYFSSPGYDLNFQVVLFADGSFEYRYGTMAPPPAGSSTAGCTPASCVNEVNGSRATIGYQTVDTRSGFTLHYGGLEGDPEPSGGSQYMNGERWPLSPLPGGLANRSFRYSPTGTSPAEVTVNRRWTHELCGISGAFRQCKAVTIRPVAEPGDLVISEAMIDPAGGAANQWFEVRNVSDQTIDLEGFRIASDAGSHTIVGSLPVLPGAFATFAASAGAGITASYTYGTELPLSRFGDTLRIIAGTAAISTMSWGIDWTIPSGQSLALDPSLQAPGIPVFSTFHEWCPAGAAGSPGAVGRGCLNETYDVDPSSTRPFIDISTTGARLGALEGMNVMAKVEVPGFSMPFFDQTIRHVWAGSNGWVSFTEGAPTASPGTVLPLFNRVLPRAASHALAGPLVAANWQELQCDRVTTDCKFFYRYAPVDGEDVLILQWDGYQRRMSSEPPGNMSFQVQLWQSGDVVVAFGDVIFDDRPGSVAAAYNKGGAAYIGIEAADRTNLLTGHFYLLRDMAYRSFLFTRK